MTGSGPRELYIFGAGGHGRELGWLARAAVPEAELTYVVDEGYDIEASVNEIPVVTISALAAAPGAGFVVAVGDAELRRAAASRLAALGLTAVSLVHPGADLAPNVRIGPGAVVSVGSILSDRVELGEHAHVNVGCTLAHDVRVGALATMSPGVHVAGNVVIGEGAFLGIGASVINGTSQEPLTIGAGALIAAGAAVTGPVAPGARVGGVPARELRGEGA